MAKVTCPHCGASVDSGRTVCPNCRMVFTKKSSLKTYLIIIALVVIVVAVVAVVLLLPAQPHPLSVPATQSAASVASAADEVPAGPQCSVAVSGHKNPPASIQLQVMTTTCYPGDITELRVSVNGKTAGTLGTTVGSSGTFAGSSRSNNVVVTAKFSTGTESVVYQNAAL